MAQSFRKPRDPEKGFLTKRRISWTSDGGRMGTCLFIRRQGLGHFDLRLAGGE
jgi:hypothetical protein